MMATNIRSETLRNIFENALSGAPDGYHIVKYDDAIKPRISSDIKEHKSEMELMREKLIKTIANPNMWRPNNTVKGNGHTGRVGKTKCGASINKKDFSKAGRLYVLRYFDAGTDKTYIMLVGYQLSHQRKIDWRVEVKEIISRFGGEVYDELKDEIDEIDQLDSDSPVNDMHGGYFNAGDGALTEKKTEILLHEGNMTITDGQFAKIMTNPPLLIDGHAGTGKSIIIALRIAFDIYYYNEQKERAKPKLLVVAYNQKVLDNIQKFAEYWIKQLIKGNIGESYFDCIEYIPTLKLYHSLMKTIDRKQTPEPEEAKFIAKYVSFYKFESVFFEQHRKNPSRISAEECWHFIRGIMKGQGFGWLGNDEITIEDFASEKDGGKITKRYTQHMPRHLIEANLELFRKYEDWRTDNNFLDDIDLVRRAGEGTEKEPHGEMLNQYTNILIDEAQDLTTEEYKLILKLLADKGKVKLIVAGDPLQTINPTGFSWNVLQAFIISIIGKKDKIKPERMLVSHRMPNNLVKMANVIINARNNLLPSEKSDLMEAHSASNEMQGLIQTIRYDENDSSQNHEMQDFINDILPKNVGILLWARDRGELKDIGERDKAISSLRKNLGQSVIDIHSIESVKGLEYEAVVLYRFADLDSNFSKIETILDSPEDATDALYHNLYFLNRLFIALTRSKKNIYIIDSGDNIKQIWNNTLWSSSIDTSVEFSTFMKDFDVEPSLDKARQYFESAKNKRDIELMQRALASAIKCEQSDERDNLIDQINMHKTNLEMEIARARGDKAEVKVLTEKMISIYDKDGNILSATYLRIKSGLWDELKEVLDKNSKIPEIILIYRFIKIRYHHSMKDLETLIEGGINLIKDSDVRKILSHEIKELAKTHMKEFKTDKNEINVKIINKLQKPPYNFQHKTIIQRLMTPWIEDGAITQDRKNNNLATEYVELIRTIWSDIESNKSKVPANARIAYYNHLLNNPNRGKLEGERYVDALTLLGDKNATRKHILTLFGEQEKFSITDNIWGKIYTLLQNDENTDWSKHAEFRDRLRKVDDLNKWTTISALNAVQNLCKKDEHQYFSGLEILNHTDIKIKINAGLYGLQPDDLHKMFREIANRFSASSKIKLLINGKIDLLEKLINVFKDAKKEALLITILKKGIDDLSSPNTEYNGKNIFMILEKIGINQKHLVGSKNSFYKTVAKWLDEQNLLNWIRKSDLVLPFKDEEKEAFTRTLPDALAEKVILMWAMRNAIDAGKPSEETYNSFLLSAQKLGMIDLVDELLPHANATEQVKLKNHLLIQQVSELKKYNLNKIYEILKDDIKQIKWGDVSWENSGWASPRGAPKLLLEEVKYPKSYESQALIMLLTGHTVSDLFYEIMISMFLGKNMSNIAKAVIPEGFKKDFFTKKYPQVQKIIKDKNEINHHWLQIERFVLNEIMPPASIMGHMHGWALICLSFIDALVLYGEITTQTKRIIFAKSLGLKDIKKGTSKPDTIKLILGTDLFQHVFKVIPNLETSVKGILDF